MSPRRELTLSEWFGKKGWIPFRLQSLPPTQFINTVNRILNDQNIIIPYERCSEEKGERRVRH